MGKIYTLHTKQVLPIGLEDAWEFFSSPKNLSIITPPRMNFEILGSAGTGKMYKGQIIQYKVTVLPFVRMFWETEITEVNELYSFTDVQRKGPYAHWQHKHIFTPVARGVEMTDELEYSIPYGLLGRLANYSIVEREVKSIFDFRYKVLEKRFNGR